MSFKNLLVLISCVVGAAALLLCLDIFKPQREQLISLLPTNLKGRVFGDLHVGATPKDRLFTLNELERYRGQVYLAILGQVFDVTKGGKHYGPGGTYHFFTEYAGTRAFASGDFSPQGLTENLDGLSLEDIQKISDWVNFYHKQYTYKGKITGHFYDKNGNPTKAMNNFERLLEQAKKKPKYRDEDRKRFPRCITHYEVGLGRTMTCTKNSHGIKRDWIGILRQYYQPGDSHTRCACVRDKGRLSSGDSSSNNGDLNHPYLKVYEGCKPTATSCFIEDTNLDLTIY